MAKLSGKWAEAQKEIYAVLEKHGMSGAGFRVSMGAYESRVTLVVKNDSAADPFAKAAAEFKMYYDLIGFKSEWLGKSFQYGAKVFTLKGLDMAKKKNTCVIVDASGKTFIAPNAAIKYALERAA
jgi:hypothetical protein